MQTIRTMLQGLTLNDVREWAGTKIYNRGRDYVDAVAELSRTEDGTLVARVSGSDEYVTSVRHDGNGEFSHSCSCPYDDVGPCKHAVAVLLAAAARLKENKEIPLLDPGDDLHLELFDNSDDDDEFDDDEESEEDAESLRDDEDDQNPVCRVSLPKSRSSKVEKILAGKSREELLALLNEVATQHPEVARKVRESAQLERGRVEPLVRALRKEIRGLTAESAWYNHWKGVGNLPDYSGVEKRLQALLAGGQADAVVQLGEELWKRGNEQVGQSDDEGDTATAIAGCLAVVLEAVPLTSMPPAQQLLWVVNRSLEDEYGLLEGADTVLSRGSYTEAQWREVAAELETRLKKMGKPSSARFSATYQREKLLSWLLDASRRGGQTERVIPLLEKEADTCRCYGMLVDALLAAGKRDQARKWCIDGYGRTINDAPGLAAGLQERLRKLAEAEKNFALAAAYRAEDFFARPSIDGYQQLRKSAEKVKGWETVREGALAYLRTGSYSDCRGKPWPLPAPEVRRPKTEDKYRRQSFPDLEMLIEIAILEKRNDDAVLLYQELNKTRRWGREIDKQLAKAVSGSHPQIALQIWKAIADNLIAQVKPRAYEEAAGYLKLMHKLYEGTGRTTDWQRLLLDLRVQHKAKRRLMEVLDDLEKLRKSVPLI